jgi:hypothetical protein
MRGIGHVFSVLAIFKVPQMRIYERYRTCILFLMPFSRFLKRESTRGTGHVFFSCHMQVHPKRDE